jgi:hypothetical protein
MKRLLGVVAVTAAATALAVAPAEAAGTKVSSVVKYCRDFAHDGYGGAVSYSDYNAKCAQVYTTISSLTVRSRPSTAGAKLGSLTGGRVYEFDCWAYGSSVDTNRIWLVLYSAAGGPRFVSDRYMYTGPDVKTKLSHCTWWDNYAG